MDTQVASWMLNPDLVASRSFAELLNTFDLKMSPKQVCLVFSQMNVVFFRNALLV